MQQTRTSPTFWLRDTCKLLWRTPKLLKLLLHNWRSGIISEFSVFCFLRQQIRLGEKKMPLTQSDLFAERQRHDDDAVRAIRPSAVSCPQISSFSTPSSSPANQRNCYRVTCVLQISLPSSLITFRWRRGRYHLKPRSARLMCTSRISFAFTAWPNYWLQFPSSLRSIIMSRQCSHQGLLFSTDLINRLFVTSSHVTIVIGCHLAYIPCPYWFWVAIIACLAVPGSCVNIDINCLLQVNRLMFIVRI